jgi:hypothetical protein
VQKTPACQRVWKIGGFDIALPPPARGINPNCKRQQYHHGQPPVYEYFAVTFGIKLTCILVEPAQHWYLAASNLVYAAWNSLSLSSQSGFLCAQLDKVFPNCKSA